MKGVLYGLRFWFALWFIPSELRQETWEFWLRRMALRQGELDSFLQATQDRLERRK